ncbi:MAG: pyridoxamine 5'-phosphate oxidase family protein [Clostridiales Family XIII bacterium]|nr:pyridoxamine 5'-phosphate oxidase family protein [Clostridiales Family XIII bacterium]
MFRAMRRTGKERSKEEAERILREASYGTLALCGDAGYPYSLPVNHVYADGKIFFHCATTGHKLDAIRGDDRVSFSVVARDEVVPEEFHTHFLSAVAFGRARVLSDDDAKRRALERILERFSPDHIEAGKAYIERDFDKVAVVEITIEHLTAKSGV